MVFKAGQYVGNEWAKTHGLSKTPEFRIWTQAKKRCYAPAVHEYPAYGGRGITMCDEWRDDFLAFLRHMGPRPSPEHSLERLDVNGNYEPGNCVWAPSVKAQARNRRSTKWIEFACRKMSFAEACELAGVPHGTIYMRMRRMGLTFFQAIAYVRPSGPGRRARW
jgi:hypothetical protein